MEKLIQYKYLSRLFLYLSSLWLLLFFIFMPHYIELSETLETWLPTKGLVMYKDIAMFHLPLGKLVLLPLHLISKWNLELDPFVGLAIGIATLLFIYHFSKRFLSQKATSIALIFFSLFYWFFGTSILYFHEQLIGLLLTAALLLLFQLHKYKSISGKKIFRLGLILSLAEFSGQIASITVFVAALLAFYILWKRKAQLLRNSLMLASGLALPFAVLVLYFISQSALWDFIYWTTLSYFTYAGFVTPISELPFKELILFYLPLIILTFIFIYKLLKKEKISFEFLTVFLLTISSVPFITRSVFHPHHLNYPLGILAIAAGYSFDQLIKFKAGNKLFATTTVIFLFLGAFTLLSWYKSHITFPPSLKIVNDVYPGDPMFNAIEWVKKNTNSNNKLMVVGDPLFYMRSDRLTASRPAKSIPYTWEPIEDVSSEILQTPPIYWVVDRQFIKKLIVDYKKENMVRFLDGELKACYSLKETFENWEIWEKKCN